MLQYKTEHSQVLKTVEKLDKSCNTEGETNFCTDSKCKRQKMYATEITRWRTKVENMQAEIFKRRSKLV